MKFDFTITIGTLINLVGFAAILITAYTRYVKLEMKVDEMYEWFKKRRDRLELKLEEAVEGCAFGKGGSHGGTPPV